MQGFQEEAQTRGDVHKRSWGESVWALGDAIVRDRVFSLAAGVAFYAILAIFPALGATIRL